MKWGKLPEGISILFLFLLLIGCSPATQYIPQLSSADPKTRGQAAEALGLLGSESFEAVDKLIHMVRRDPDVEVRRLAVDALGCIQPPMSAELCDAFILAMNDRDIHIRRAGVIAISRFSNFPPNIITMLSKHLTDSDRLVCELVMSVFERIGLLGVRTLLRALEDTDDNQRLSAVVTLGRLGEYAESAVDALKEIEGNDSNDTVRKAASEALRVIIQ